jgi:hydantoinase/carbamoylase family amidase
MDNSFAGSPTLERVRDRIEKLFDLVGRADGGALRLAYSAEEARAMMLVGEWLEEAGLEVGKDRYGNLWGMPLGWNGAVVTSGSHVDTVPGGGRFDGALGTVLAVECARRLSGPCGVLVCAAEEAPRFGAGTLGSRSLLGKLSEEDLHTLRDSEGVSVAEARAFFLRELDGLPAVDGRILLPRIVGHVEVHIEQRRGLMDAGASLGIATALAGPTRYRLRFSGRTGHSGETLPSERRDALCAASEVILLAESLSRRAASTVITVGTVHLSPNSLTAIPGKVELGLDVRTTDEDERDLLLTRLFEGAAGAARSRTVEFSADLLSSVAPTELDEGLISAAEGVCRMLGVPSRRCASMAGHDVGHLGTRVPAALLFVPSTNGVSHAPEEEIDWKDAESALEVLCALLKELEPEGGDR